MNRLTGRALGSFCLSLAVVAGALGSSPDEQLGMVRDRIRSLQQRLEQLDAEAGGVRARQQRLSTELELAQARVHELEIELTTRRDQIVGLREEVRELSARLDGRRASLRVYLEMMVLLGNAGPVQLVYDGARGGELLQSLETVVTLTRGQLAGDGGVRRAANQATTSAGAAEPSGSRRRVRRPAELVERRRELEAVRARVERQLETVEARRSATEHELEEMQTRAAALERLLGRLADHERITGNDDILEFRGALPWPVRGPVARTFGKHFLEKYATYTICNGLRLHVEGGTEVCAVFPGVVAYARYFKGYGNMVVIDHGREVFSVSTGLGSVLVDAGQRVEMGRAVGVAGPAKEGGNFYFEIRVDGQPQDPSVWLQL